MDSLADGTEVPDSQEPFDDVDQSVVADALLSMATSTDVLDRLDKENEAVVSLLLPVFLPCIYGSQDEDVHDAVVTLLDRQWDDSWLWTGNGAR